MVYPNIRASRPVINPTWRISSRFQVCPNPVSYTHLVSDRRVLFYLIEGDRYALHPRTSESVVGRELEEEPSVDRTLSLIDAFLATVPEEHSQTTELDYSMDYTCLLYTSTSHGLFTTIRASRGEDIFAACGMLSTAKQEENKQELI